MISLNENEVWIIKMKKLKIAVAGTGYVGLSLAVLFAQNHQVTAVDVVPEKVEMINQKNPLYKMIILRIFLLLKT